MLCIRACGLTSTAPATSAAVLHFANPSTMAPTASSTYFSSASCEISLRRAGTAACWFNDERNLTRRAVCRFSEVSNLPSPSVPGYE